MITVKLSMPNNFPFLRQLPKNHEIFKDIQFVLNESIDSCDFWIVYDKLVNPETTFCNKQNIFFFTGEPKSIKTYNHQFINQFHTLITNQYSLKHPNVNYSQTCLPWLVGIEYNKETKCFSTSKFRYYDDYKLGEFTEKPKLISVITSNKTISKGHKRRLDFVLKLKDILGDQLDIFGSGFNDIPDKADALNHYKYSLVIENSSFKHYWTEKIADAFLSECYPIYYGCPNIGEYFDNRGFDIINFDKIELSIEKIKNIIKSNVAEKNRQYIIENKRRVLNQYNLFFVIADLIKDRSALTLRKELVTLIPENQTIFDKLKTKINRLI